MAGLFADVKATFTLDFEDGSAVTLRKFADAGIQEDLERDMIRYRRRLAQESEKDDADEDGKVEDRIVHFSTLKFVQKMLISIRTPDGRTEYEPFGMAWVKRFDRQAFAEIVEELNFHNPPLLRNRREENKLPEVLTSTDLDQVPMKDSKTSAVESVEVEAED